MVLPSYNIFSENAIKYPVSSEIVRILLKLALTFSDSRDIFLLFSIPDCSVLRTLLTLVSYFNKNAGFQSVVHGRFRC